MNTEGLHHHKFFRPFNLLRFPQNKTTTTTTTTEVQDCPTDTWQIAKNNLYHEFFSLNLPLNKLSHLTARIHFP